MAAIDVSFMLGLFFGFFIAFLLLWLINLKAHKKTNALLMAREQQTKELNDTLIKQTAEIALQAERLLSMGRLEHELTVANHRVIEAHKEQAGLVAKIASLEMENKKAHEYFENRMSDLTAIHDRMKNAFSQVSQDALVANANLIKNSFNQSLEHFFQVNDKDRTQSQELLANIMNPLKESLTLVNSKVSELESKRQGAYDGLKEQIEGLLKSQTVLQKETQTLSRALYAPTTRGRWGEMQLKRVVELSGLSSHCDFIEQLSVKSDNEILRPDMVVTLPKNKKIVIDAKAPIEFISDDMVDGDEQGIKLAASLKRHLLSLKKKSYHTALGETPEFVVMFLPSEAFLHRALIADRELLDFAAQNEILITTPITLVALLKSIAFGFSQETIANNIEEVRRLSQELIDRIDKVSSHFEKLGRSLKQSCEAYNQTLASLDSRVLVTARKLVNIKSVVKDDHDILKGDIAMIDIVPVMPKIKEGDIAREAIDS